MADILQKHLRGTTRAVVETALEIGEIGANEASTQLEAIYEMIAGSAYLHFPSLERLDDITASSSGASLIGVEDDSFTNITGDTDLQTCIKSIDTYLSTIPTISNVVLTDGSVPMVANWDTGGYDFTGMGNLEVDAGNYIGIGSSSARHYYAAGIIGIIGADFGVGTIAPDGKLHVKAATSGATVDTNADDNIIESNVNVGTSYLTADAYTSSVYFGSNTDAKGALIDYTHDSALMRIGTDLASGELRLLSGSSNATMQLISTGDVGIGFSPSRKLDVNGTFRAVGAVDLSSTLTMGGNIIMGNNTYIGQPAGVTAQFDDTNNYLEISGGNVGIGTAAPAVLLNIKTATGGELYGFQLDSGGTGQKMVEIGHETTNEAILNMYSGITRSIQLSANGDTFFNGGNVGINDGTPTYKLDVNGTGRYTGELNANDDIILTATKTIGATNAGGMSFDGSNNASFTNDVILTNATGSLVIQNEGTIDFDDAGGTPRTVLQASTGNDIYLGNASMIDLFLSAGTAHDVIIRDGNNVNATFGPSLITLAENTKINAGQLHIEKDQDALTEMRLDNTNSGTSIDHMSYSMYDAATLQFDITHNNNTDKTTIENHVGQLELNADDLRITSDTTDVYVGPNTYLYVNAGSYVDLTANSGDVGLYASENVVAVPGNAWSFQVEINSNVMLNVDSTDVTIDDANLVFTGTGGLSCGSLYLHEGSQNVDISAVGQGVYVKVTGLTTGKLNNVTINSDAFNVGAVGFYKVEWQISGDSQGNNKDYEVDIFVNGVEQADGSSRQEFPTTASLSSMSGTGIIDVTNTGHDIDIRMKEIGAGAGTDFDIFNMNFNIFQLTGT